MAFAQSIPNGTITQGEVWTPAQWNAAWQAKQDYTAPPNLSSVNTQYVYSSAESSVGIAIGSITNYGYQPGDPRRYGATACATYGACTTGDTDSTAALNTACKLGNVNIFYYYYRVTSTVTCSFTQGLVTFTGGAFLQATSGFSGTYVLNLTGAQMLVMNAGIDSGALSISGSTPGGIEVNGGANLLIAPYVAHFHGSGVNGIALISSVAGDSVILRGYGNEWLNSDSQFGTDANFTATALYVNRADCYVIDSTFRWSGINVFVDSGFGDYLVHSRPLLQRSARRAGSRRSDQCIRGAGCREYLLPRQLLR